MDLIRKFESTDIEQVADLHRNVFSLTITRPERHRAYFSEQFLSSDPASPPSLVYESEDGRILGFLGVAARRFCFGNKKITAALSSQFVVHPDGRGRLTGIHLLREFLNGPQELSFTDEANETSKRIWVALGGAASIVQGVHWVVPLRPVELACCQYAPAWVAATFGGAARVLDRFVSSLPHSPFHNRKPELYSEPLSAEDMLTYLNDVIPQYDLRPHYDWRSLGDLMQRAGRKKDGLLRGRLLRDKTNRVAGWYLFHRTHRGLAEVLQTVSREDCHQHVIEHLASDARSQGAIAVVGRLEPGLAEPLANQFCFLFRRKYTMLVHSRFPEILSAIHSGHAFISRLDGEWCLRFA